MICSPCRDCPNIILPKDICSKTCEKLQTIQEIQLSLEGDRVYSTADYFDTDMLEVNHSSFPSILEAV